MKNPILDICHQWKKAQFSQSLPKNFKGRFFSEGAAKFSYFSILHSPSFRSLDLFWIKLPFIKKTVENCPTKIYSFDIHTILKIFFYISVFINYEEDECFGLQWPIFQYLLKYSFRYDIIYHCIFEQWSSRKNGH